MIDVGRAAATWRAQKTHTHRGGDRPRRGPRRGPQPRLAESINLAVRHGDGLVLASHEEETAARQRRLARRAVQHAVRLSPTARSATRSWSRGRSASTAPTGPARACEGLGARVAFDPGAGPARPRISRWPTGRSRRGKRLAAGGAAEADTTRLRPLLAAAGMPLEHAAGEAEAARRWGSCCTATASDFPACWPMLEKEYATTASEPKRQRLETFRGEVVCPECGGARLRPEARAVRIAGRAIHEIDGPDGRPRPASSSQSLEPCRRVRAADRRADPRRDRAPGWSFSTAWGWTI